MVAYKKKILSKPMTHDEKFRSVIQVLCFPVEIKKRNISVFGTQKHENTKFP